MLGGIVQALRQAYPEGAVLTAATATAALAQLQRCIPNVVILDLGMPEATGAAAQIQTGLHLLKTLLEGYPDLNIAVHSAHSQRLIGLKPAIDRHQAGLTIIDKSQPLQEFLTLVDWAMQSRTYTPKELRQGLELRPAWLEVLDLAFGEGLQDVAIAQRMHVSERTVQNYWTKIRNVLEVYPDEDKNLRIQTEIQARSLGLID